MGLSRRDKDAQRFRNDGRHYRKASLKEFDVSVRMVPFPLIRFNRRSHIPICSLLIKCAITKNPPLCV